MEQTFMTIHNLSPDANILFASDSIIDILGYQPREVLGRSCFEYFHPQEVPFARSVHSRGVLMDKAAVLHYARVQSSDGRWVSCECCFTVVHDVLVACTSVYRRGLKSERRAIEAPHIRRIFSSSPRDPRYHMLEHLSPKFKMPPMEREPRAALILNRFTRSLTIMFATNSVASILGVPAEQVQGKSFWECIAENCLPDAVQCLESAKQNDSIAYLRFWYRDPRRDEDFEQEVAEARNEVDEYANSSTGSDSDGGVRLDDTMDVDSDTGNMPPIKSEPDSHFDLHAAPMRPGLEVNDATATSSSSSSTATLGRNLRPVGAQVVNRRLTYAAGEPSRRRGAPSRNGSRSIVGGRDGRRRRQQRARQASPPVRRPQFIPTFELEAVVSCTSDGLVVILRRARPPIPDLQVQASPLPMHFENGLFAAPWGEPPHIGSASLGASLDIAAHAYAAPSHGQRYTPPPQPAFSLPDSPSHAVESARGPPMDQLMRSIRDVAVFAWALAGINGNLASYGRGVPGAGSQPEDGLPIWDPMAVEESKNNSSDEKSVASGQCSPVARAHTPLDAVAQNYHSDSYKAAQHPFAADPSDQGVPSYDGHQISQSTHYPSTSVMSPPIVGFETPGAWRPGGDLSHYIPTTQGHQHDSTN